MKKFMVLMLTLFVNVAASGNVFYDNAGDVTLNTSVDGSVYVDNYDYVNGPYDTPTNLTIMSGVTISNQIRTYGYSSVSITGNSSFGGILNMVGYSMMTMSGDVQAKSDINLGSFASISISENASAAGALVVHNWASIHLYVTDFSVNGQVLTEDVKLSDYGVMSDRPNTPYVGTISGIMEHGLEFSNDFKIYNTGQYYGSADIYVHIIPEPTTLSLLTLGGLALLRKRK
jgi:hypothetical protein